MKRVTLPPNLPPQTPAFKRFERSAVALNRFYWTFRCSLTHTLSSLAPHTRIPELVPGEIGEHIDITCAQFRSEAPAAERMARYTLLAMSVTVYEDYLREITSQFLLKHWKQNSTYKVSFRPEELPSDATLTDFIRERAIKTRVEDLISKNYSSRIDSLCHLLTEFGVARPTVPADTQKYATAACEARNCIIHSGGVVDERAREALSAFIPQLAKDSQLECEQALLWHFLGALRDSARIFDNAIRAKPNRTGT